MVQGEWCLIEKEDDWVTIPWELLIKIGHYLNRMDPMGIKTLRIVCQHWHDCVNYTIRSLHLDLSMKKKTPLKSLCQKFQNVAVLDLTASGGTLTADDLQHISLLKKLQVLKLGSLCTSMDYIRALPDLQALSLMGCENLKEDCIMENLAGNMSIVDLDLTDCIQMTDDALSCIACMSALSKLTLSGCCMITDIGVAWLKRSTGLLYLDLSHCYQLTDECLLSIATLPSLQYLSLAECYEITGDGIAYLNGMSQLQKLHLSGCLGILDLGLHQVRELACVQELSISSCDNIGNEGMVQVGRMAELRLLDISFCPKVTCEGLYELRALPNLTHLNLAGCSCVTLTELPSSLSMHTKLACLVLP